MSCRGRNVAVGNPMPGAWWGWGRASLWSVCGGGARVDREGGFSCRCSLALSAQDSEREQRHAGLPLLAYPAPTLALSLSLPLSSGGAGTQHSAARLFANTLLFPLLQEPVLSGTFRGSSPFCFISPHGGGRGEPLSLALSEVTSYSQPPEERRVLSDVHFPDPSPETRGLIAAHVAEGGECW